MDLSLGMREGTGDSEPLVPRVEGKGRRPERGR